MSASLLFSLFSSCCVALILDTGQTLRLQVLLFLFGLVGFYVPFLVWYYCFDLHWGVVVQFTEGRRWGTYKPLAQIANTDSHIDGVRV
jgi:hypothetical protein